MSGCPPRASYQLTDSYRHPGGAGVTVAKGWGVGHEIGLLGVKYRALTGLPRALINCLSLRALLLEQPIVGTLAMGTAPTGPATDEWSVGQCVAFDANRSMVPR